MTKADLLSVSSALHAFLDALFVADLFCFGEDQLARPPTRPSSRPSTVFVLVVQKHVVTIAGCKTNQCFDQTTAFAF